VVVALLLNRIVLEPGQALYSPAGRLHAYVSGLAVEVMASSDNVVRAGLTTKPVNLAELERILVVRPEPVEALRARPEGAELVYPSPAPEFRLSRLDLAEGDDFESVADGPEVLLCMRGRPVVDGERLGQGESVFLTGDGAAHRLRGPGELYRACVGW
jgi:mannose-6-phosphate isomerase